MATWREVEKWPSQNPPKNSGRNDGPGPGDSEEKRWVLGEKRQGSDLGLEGARQSS